jgi:glucosamine--fructose-6-phosphate aminotransferase (isomerizing)
VLSAPNAQEQSVVQTRSFTSMYILAAGFAYLLGEQTSLIDQLALLPEALEDITRNYGDFPAIGADWNRYAKLFFLGNGPNYGLACEAMLKVKEMSLSWVEAFHTLEFRHGPMSLVDHQTLVVGFVSDTMRQAELDVLKDLQDLGADVVLCDDTCSVDLPFAPEYHIQTHFEVNGWLRGVLFLPLMQRLGFQRAIANHQIPDQPRNLRQVIEI